MCQPSLGLLVQTMINVTQISLRLAVRAIMFCGLATCAQAQSGMDQIDSPHLEWRSYTASIDMKKIHFRFPIDTQPTTRFSFNSSPDPDRITKAIDIIGMQVGLNVNWRMVNTTYTVALGLSRSETPELSKARTINQLQQALDQHGQQALKQASGAVFRLESLKVVRLGDRDWVWGRYVENDQGGLPAFDEYYTLWDDNYLLRLHVRYGANINSDSRAVNQIKQLGEDVISSLRFE